MVRTIAAILAIALVGAPARAETTLRMATYNAEWLVATAAERSNDPWSTEAWRHCRWRAYGPTCATIKMTSYIWRSRNLKKVCKYY